MDFYDIKTYALSRKFRALSNPSRLRVVLKLLQHEESGDEMSGWVLLSELTSNLQISPSTLSHHIDVLVSCGLLFKKKKGRKLFIKADLAAYKWMSLCSDKESRQST